MEYLIQKYLSDNSKVALNGVDYTLVDNGKGIEIENWDEGLIGIAEPSFTKEEADLQENITTKLIELETYHYDIDDIRTMTINNVYELSLTHEGRNLIGEQIHNLDQQIKVGSLLEEDASFEYFYNGSSIEINLDNLRAVYIFALNIVNINYGVYKTHINNINNLQSVSAIESYDFTTNYLKNQNLDIA